MGNWEYNPTYRALRRGYSSIDNWFSGAHRIARPKPHQNRPEDFDATMQQIKAHQLLC